MEEKEVFDYNQPYFRTTYFDDNNTQHLIYITNKNDLKFLKDRFDNVSFQEIKNF